jgi:hypothetical protein
MKREEAYLQASIIRYKKFLKLKVKYPDELLIPTLDIEGTSENMSRDIENFKSCLGCAYDQKRKISKRLLQVAQLLF